MSFYSFLFFSLWQIICFLFVCFHFWKPLQIPLLFRITFDFTHSTQTTGPCFSPLFTNPCISIFWFWEIFPFHHFFFLCFFLLECLLYIDWNSEKMLSKIWISVPHSQSRLLLTLCWEMCLKLSWPNSCQCSFGHSFQTPVLIVIFKISIISDGSPSNYFYMINTII